MRRTLIALMLVTAGCSSSAEPDPRVDALEKKVAELQAELQKHSAASAATNARTNRQLSGELEAAHDRLLAMEERVAELTQLEEPAPHGAISHLEPSAEEAAQEVAALVLGRLGARDAQRLMGMVRDGPGTKDSDQQFWRLATGGRLQLLELSWLLASARASRWPELMQWLYDVGGIPAVVRAQNLDVGDLRSLNKVFGLMSGTKRQEISYYDAAIVESIVGESPALNSFYRERGATEYPDLVKTLAAAIVDAKETSHVADGRIGD